MKDNLYPRPLVSSKSVQPLTSNDSPSYSRLSSTHPQFAPKELGAIQGTGNRNNLAIKSSTRSLMEGSNRYPNNNNNNGRDMRNFGEQRSSPFVNARTNGSEFLDYLDRSSTPSIPVDIESDLNEFMYYSENKERSQKVKLTSDLFHPSSLSDSQHNMMNFQQQPAIIDPHYKRQQQQQQQQQQTMTTHVDYRFPDQQIRQLPIQPIIKPDTFNMFNSESEVFPIQRVIDPPALIDLRIQQQQQQLPVQHHLSSNNNNHNNNNTSTSRPVEEDVTAALDKLFISSSLVSDISSSTSSSDITSRIIIPPKLGSIPRSKSELSPLLVPSPLAPPPGLAASNKQSSLFDIGRNLPQLPTNLFSPSLTDSSPDSSARVDGGSSIGMSLSGVFPMIKSKSLKSFRGSPSSRSSSPAIHSKTVAQRKLLPMLQDNINNTSSPLPDTLLGSSMQFPGKMSKSSPFYQKSSSTLGLDGGNETDDSILSDDEEGESWKSPVSRQNSETTFSRR